ncbi:hypothetical protein GCM10012280_65940 [Wenjunlia tyrosinilytica]|uniref:Uncharacterized protein n=1 Tax=Wenjunlia tyrosinilytica TaxID=1544741 RepID=A0A917ZXE7_9ACTN|nr:hypothetical protein GCM10012280_65940 [Wenjunlia tyrosinilytica]
MSSDADDRSSATQLPFAKDLLLRVGLAVGVGSVVAAVLGPGCAVEETDTDGLRVPSEGGSALSCDEPQAARATPQMTATAANGPPANTARPIRTRLTRCIAAPHMTLPYSADTALTEGYGHRATAGRAGRSAVIDGQGTRPGFPLDHPTPSRRPLLRLRGSLTVS